MSDVQANAGAEDAAPKKKSRGLLLGLVGAVLLGGGAFYGVYSDLIPLPLGNDSPAEGEVTAAGAAPAASVGVERAPDPGPTAFIALDDLVISLGPEARAKHLKVVLSVEVAPEALEDVTAVTPRIMDVLNTFLRAVDERDFETPGAMLRLRAQMLRRVQLVTPENSVRDLLIQEFVLN